MCDLQAYYKRLFTYLEADGALYWRPREDDTSGWNARFAHTRAGWLRDDGYWYVCINYQTTLAHRVIWIHQRGVIPSGMQIDHIDGHRANNRIDNLRLATRVQNSQNMKLSSANTSGIKGVYWHKQARRWRVYVSVAGKQKYFGYYEDLELAELVAIEARDKYHGDFARHA